MFTIESVTNLIWANPEKTVFNCDVKYAEFNESHPTGVDDVDQYAHIKELWEKGNSGVYGTIADFVQPPSSTEKLDPSITPQPVTTGTQTL